MHLDTPDVLKKILARKAEEVAERSQRLELPAIAVEAAQAPAPRGFTAALQRRIEAGGAGVIAEIKRASPSKGIIREDFDPPAIARSYEAAGAACLSVLTDRDFFQGDDAFLTQAREATALPVLRKDFIIAPYQVYETRALGADCMLLIAAAMGDSLMRELYELGREIGLDVLVEVHDEQELERALALEPQLVGINNRDLRTFETDLDNTLRLATKIPAGVTVVTESGIYTREEVEHIRAHGVHGFLIGESFMRANDPGTKLRELFESQ